MERTVPMTYVIIAILIGLGLGYGVSQSQAPEVMEGESCKQMCGSMMGDMKGMHGEGMMGDSMDMDSMMGHMMMGLDGKTGDAFDEAFIDEMIVHHEGAVSMAEAALKSASHQEIKDMARAIIDAQTAEIEQMKQWKKSWYSN